MIDSTHSKKRKRDTYQEDGRVTLSTSNATSAAGPIVVAFPALQPTQSTAFKCYVKDAKSSTGNSTIQDYSSPEVTIAGETDTVEFHTGVDRQPNNTSCRYLIGVHDKTTHTVKLRYAPLHVMTRDVKALKSLDPLAASAEELEKARHSLGEAFGSRKARKVIQAMERNRVDISAMEGIANHLQDSIEAGTESLPSQMAAKVIADEARSIPRCNIHAKSPDEIYALHDIISESELNSVSLVQLMSASNQKSRIASLPYQHSSWINHHLAAEFEETKPNKTNLKILFYISSMFLFRIHATRNMDQLQQRMSSVPTEIIEGLQTKFTERGRNLTKPQVTKQTQTLLLTHMLALCLRLDSYATDPTLIAADLSLSIPTIATHLKYLGCKYEPLTSAERTRLGLGPAGNKEVKYGILRVPFDFPKQRNYKRK